MKIGIVGTGYVGLVTGTCLAESGNEVTCVDNNVDKIRLLRQGKLPIYEPGLGELVLRNVQAGRLSFSNQLAEAVQGSRCLFIAVGTPQGNDGAADLSNLWSVIKALGPCLEVDQVVVIKSTVPVGTNASVAARLALLTETKVHVVSNPEFLKEGAAITDFTKPDRVVVGVREPGAAQVLHELYAPFLRTERPFLVMNPESAEITKYVANAMLATKISFINEMANLCERTGANINEVRRGIGHDARIGFSFMFPGAGYGGSCFPKDVRALVATCHAAGIEPRIIQAVDQVNEGQKELLFNKIFKYFEGRLAGLRLAVWGLAFKPGTDDIREAPSLVLIDRLLDHEVQVSVHDPVAMENVRAIYGNRLNYFDQPYGALESADGLAILTEWNEFRNPNFRIMSHLLSHKVIFDGRNLFDADHVTECGFTYFYIGQPTRETSQPARPKLAA